jgi:hypothetical protein
VSGRRDGGEAANIVRTHWIPVRARAYSSTILPVCTANPVYMYVNVYTILHTTDTLTKDRHTPRHSPDTRSYTRASLEPLPPASNIDACTHMRVARQIRAGQQTTKVRNGQGDTALRFVTKIFQTQRCDSSRIALRFVTKIFQKLGESGVARCGFTPAGRGKTGRRRACMVCLDQPIHSP